jgi:hypothetical protein
MLGRTKPGPECPTRGGDSIPPKAKTKRINYLRPGWWAGQDSNLQPDRYERPALTIELPAQDSALFQPGSYTAGRSGGNPGPENAAGAALPLLGVASAGELSS